MGLSPRWNCSPLRSLGVTALGRTLIPIQRSACDYAEVSLSLCICHRLPQVAILILTYPLYRSLPGREGHGEVEINLAWYFNADTRNVPFGPVLSWVSEEDRNKSPFTITGHCPPFWPPDFGDNFENVILHFSMSTQKGLRFETEALIKPLLLNGELPYLFVATKSGL